MQVSKIRPRKMEDNSMVYLQKPTGVSHSLLASKNPTKRPRSRMDSSQVRISSNEIHKYTRKTGSAKKEDAIVGDCSEIEVQEQGEEWRTTASRAKRTRCMYSPTPSRVDDGSLKPSSAAKQTSSKSTECDSSASNSEDLGCDQASEPSSVAGRKRLKLKEEPKDQQTSDVKDQNRDVVITKTEECLDLEVEKLHQSSLARNRVEATTSFLNPVYMDNQHVMEIVLVDVQLTVDANPQAENVPFVSLTSGAYGIAVVGYPLDVGEIRDGSETSLLLKETVPCNVFGDGGSRLDQLVWKTSRRSPVCYVTGQLSASISKGVEGSILPDGDNGLPRKEKSVTKFVKNRKQFNQGKTAPNKTCVPVELIFSKILAAVDQVQKVSTIP